VITVHDYHRMAATGLLAPDARVELLEGRIVAMAPIGTRHNACVVRLTRLFVRGLGDRAVVNPQGSMRLNLYSEPQPDVGIYRPRDDDYASGYAEPEDTLLLVEVAESTARSDRRRKIPLYRKAGIPEVWLVDLEARVVEVYLGDTLRTVRPGDTLTPQAFPDVEIDVAYILV